MDAIEEPAKTLVITTLLELPKESLRQLVERWRRVNIVARPISSWETAAELKLGVILATNLPMLRKAQQFSPALLHLVMAWPIRPLVVISRQEVGEVSKIIKVLGLRTPGFITIDGPLIPPPPRYPPKLNRGDLSDRELQVLRGMAQGKSNGQIGRDMHLSEDTIKTHARRLFRKLGARDRAQAVGVGFRRGLVN